MEELVNILTLPRIILYLLVINLVAFFMMFWDKKKAEKGKWRIEESTLFSLALMGGSIGAIAGMYKFRHKTKKLRFTIGFPVILITQIVLVIMVVGKLGPFAG